MTFYSLLGHETLLNLVYHSVLRPVMAYSGREPSLPCRDTVFHPRTTCCVIPNLTLLWEGQALGRAAGWQAELGGGTSQVDLHRPVTLPPPLSPSVFNVLVEPTTETSASEALEKPMGIPNLTSIHCSWNLIIS